jgi:hypothetical protein
VKSPIVETQIVDTTEGDTGIHALADEHGQETPPWHIAAIYPTWQPDAKVAHKVVFQRILMPGGSR